MPGRQKTSTANTQEVTMQQSQAFAQVAVHATFSAIAHARDLFVDEAFNVKSPADVTNLKDYDDYVKISQQLSAPSNIDAGRVGYKFLVRGQLPVVDKVLNAMENAFKAVEQRVLDALVFSICLDPKRPQDVIESYSYTFAYRSSPNGTLVDVTMNSMTKTLTLKDVKMALQQTISMVTNELQDKPQLPDDRYIIVRLLYNDDWDGELDIPGFRTDKNGFNTAELKGWDLVTHTTSGMLYDAGYKGVSLMVSRLEPKPDTGVNNGFETEIPTKGLRYKKVLPRSLVDQDINERIDAKRLKRAGVLEPASQSTVAPSQDHSLPSPPTTDVIDLPHVFKAPLPSQPMSQMTTQHLQDFKTSRSLEKAANIPKIVTSDGETQVLNSIGSHEVDASASSKLVFKPELVDELRSLVLSSQHRPLDNTVACDCECEDDTDIRQCEICKNCQHIACYGYLTPEDPRLPNMHICYTCLLNYKESALLPLLVELAKTRRVARAMMLRQYRTEAELAKAVGLDLSSTTKVCNQLASLGFILRSKKKGNQRVEVIPAKRAQLEAHLFDPAKLITQHLHVPTVQSTEAMTMDHTMPPPPSTIPKTPALPSRKRKSGLDPGQRVTPLAQRRKTRCEANEVLKLPSTYQAPAVEDASDGELY